MTVRVFHNNPAVGVKPIPHFHIRELKNCDRSTAQRLRDAVLNPGFIAVLGLEDQLPLIEQSNRLLERYMTLPDETLRQYTTPHSQRGAVVVGETAVGSTVLSKIRFTMTHPEIAPADPSDMPFGGNIWPEEVPEFRDAHMALLRAQHADAFTVLGAFERAFEIPDGEIIQTAIGAEHLQRGIYTDGAWNTKAGEIIADAHEDINYITGLWPEPGLEVYLPDDNGNHQWFVAGIEKGAKAYNTGEMFSELGIVRERGAPDPTRHRVVSDGSGRTRITNPLFLHGKHSTLLRDNPSDPYVHDGRTYDKVYYRGPFGVRLVGIGAWNLRDRDLHNLLMRHRLLEYVPELWEYRAS